MQSRIITVIAAAAIGLTGLTATPAAAWGEKEQNALALILGLGVAATIIHEAEKSKKRKPQTPVSAPARKVIPGECVYDINTSAGRKSVVSRSCVTEFGLTRLPADCAFDVRSASGVRTVYGPRCLQDFGYRIGGGRY
jgi:hypothetical protein